MASVESAATGRLAKPIRIDWAKVLCTAVLGIVAFMVLGPLLVLLINSFQLSRPGQPPQFGLANWIVALTEPGMLQAIWNTITRTAIATAVSFPVGVLVAWLLARTDIPAKGWLDLLFWMAFFLPVLPVTLGWVLLLDPDFGVINKLLMGAFSLSEAPFTIYSFAGIVWVHLVTRTIATKVILLTPAFRNMDSSLEEVSRVSGSGYLRTMTRVFIPVMAPAITVVFLMSIIHSLESFEIEQVLGPAFNFYVYSTKMYQLISREPANYGAATVLGVIILLVMVPLIIMQHRVSSGRRYTTVTGQYKGQLFRLGHWRWPAFALVMSLGMLFTVIPLCFLILGSVMRLFGFFDIPSPYTLGHWERILTHPTFLRSLQNSLILGVSTAAVAVIGYSLVAYVAVKTRFFARSSLDLLSWLPITIPGVIMGLGLLWLFLNVPFLRPMYGTPFILVWATALSSMTLGVQLVKSHLLQLSNELEECSLVAGGTWLYTFRRIVVPLLTPALVTVGMVAFITAVRNVAHIAILVTSSNQPLAIFQLNHMTDGSYESAAVIGVVVVVMTTGVALLGRQLGLRFGMQH